MNPKPEDNIISLSPSFNIVKDDNELLIKISLRGIKEAIPVCKEMNTSFKNVGY